MELIKYLRTKKNQEQIIQKPFNVKTLPRIVFEPIKEQIRPEPEPVYRAPLVLNFNLHTTFKEYVQSEPEPEVEKVMQIKPYNLADNTDIVGQILGEKRMEPELIPEIVPIMILKPYNLSDNTNSLAEILNEKKFDPEPNPEPVGPVYREPLKLNFTIPTEFTEFIDDEDPEPDIEPEEELVELVKTYNLFNNMDVLTQLLKERLIEKTQNLETPVEEPRRDKVLKLSERLSNLVKNEEILFKEEDTSELPPKKEYKLSFNKKLNSKLGRFETPTPAVLTPIDKPVKRQKLECIGLLTTSFELNSGRLKTFLDNTLPTLTKTKLDFVIFLNKKVDITDLVAPYKKFFNVVVVSHDIPEKDDVRVDGPNTLEYGGCSGPNIQFLMSARYCKKYNTTLFVETDCTLQKGWLHACINYVRFSGTFLISGATYDGSYKIPVNHLSYYRHINGVAFYNTGSPYFTHVIDETDSLIRRKALKGETTAYDVAISQVFEEKKYDDYEYWKFIYRQITKNTLIVNYSLPLDKDTPLKDILFRFPGAVIIHKK